MNTDSEKILIGAWLSGYHTDTIEQFKPSDFAEYGSIVRAIKKLRANHNKIDVLAVSTETQNEYRVSDLTEMARTYWDIEFESAYKTIKTESAKRLITNASSELNVNNLQDILKSVNKTLEDISAQALDEPTDWCKEFEKELEIKAKNKPVKYGLKKLDKLTTGIHRGELTTISARPSVGKTAFALQVAQTVAEQGERVLFFPLEMTQNQLVGRLICSNTNIDHNRLRIGKLQDEEKQELQEFLPMLKELQKTLIILPKTRTLPSIKRAIIKYKPTMVIIDQLTQLQDPSVYFKDKRARFDHCTGTLKSIALNNNVAIMLLAQINRDAQDSIPDISNLKESGCIEEDSDNVLMLHRFSKRQTTDMGIYPNYESLKKENLEPMLLRIGKQRDGAIDDIYCVAKKDKFLLKEL